MALDALRLSAGLLTVLPVGRMPALVGPTAARAIVLAPLAVLPLGLAAGLVDAAAAWAGLPSPAVGLLVVGALALGTRALHLDGLADTVDGLGAGWDRERAVAVMRRGDVGPMGAVALIVVLGLQAASLAALTRTAGAAAAVVLVVCASRCALTLVCRRGVPALRADGLGAAVASSVRDRVAAGSWLVAAALLVGAAALAGLPWWHGLVAAGLALAATLGLLRHVRRRLGGVNGDVMGAAVEVALTAMLLGLAT